VSDDEPEERAPQADPPAASEEPSPSPQPRRRKKRRRAAREADAQEAREAPEPSEQEPKPEDESVPAFARAFPHEPALDALVSAFEAGDYARVRREAPALARQTDRDDVRAAARELARRLDPDPLAVYLLGAAALLLTFLAGWYWAHPHTP
jgi:hypothetical protein